jgi:hypothetical protein
MTASAINFAHPVVASAEAVMANVLILMIKPPMEN